jgi:hypothetical protein
MRKIICILLAVVMLFSLTACKNKDKEASKTDDKQTITTEKVEKTEQTESTEQTEKTEPTIPEKETEAPTEPEKETFVPELLEYRIYLPNENANGFDTKIIECEYFDIEDMIQELKNHNALPEDVVVNDYGFEGNTINIDFNEAFGNYMNTMGTSGELMVTGTVVNTLIDAFDVEYVFFTVNGEIFESGHAIYDTPIGFVFVQ